MKIRTEFPRTVREIEHFTIPMADGVQLAARMWLPEDAETDPAEVLARGEQVLADIPGVREAIGARAGTEDAPYSHAWWVRLCHPAAVTSFQNHPATADCCGIQYLRAGNGPGHRLEGLQPSAPEDASATKVAPLFPDSRRNRA